VSKGRSESYKKGEANWSLMENLEKLFNCAMQDRSINITD